MTLPGKFYDFNTFLMNKCVNDIIYIYLEQASSSLFYKIQDSTFINGKTEDNISDSRFWKILFSQKFPIKNFW